MKRSRRLTSTSASTPARRELRQRTDHGRINNGEILVVKIETTVEIRGGIREENGEREE